MVLSSHFSGTIAWLVAAVLCSSSPRSLEADLIINGEFEDPLVYPGSFQTNTSATQGIAGWTIAEDFGGAGVDVIGSLWTGSSNMAGDQSVDIDFASTLSQSFTTAPGSAYEVSFSYSHNPSVLSSTGSVSVAGAGDLLLSGPLTHNLSNSSSDMNWLQFVDTFVADSTSVTLTLAGDFNNGTEGWVVDRVSVMPVSAQAVPEPSSLALLGCASMTLAIGAARHRRRERKLGKACLGGRKSMT